MWTWNLYRLQVDTDHARFSAASSMDSIAWITPSWRQYRKTHGPFKSYEDLTLVKGIGARTVEINRANILLKAAVQKSK